MPAQLNGTRVDYWRKLIALKTHLCLLLCVTVYFCYGNAPTTSARIAPKTAHGLLRLIAFVLLCIGVQITLNGIEGIAKTMLRI